jgi:hypothetical protein
MPTPEFAMKRQPKPASADASRRTFLKATAVAAAAAAVSGPFIHAEDKSGSKNVVIGEGEFKYECLHDWGMENLPKGAGYGNASHGVTIDSAGLVYITHHGNPGSIFVFDPDGKFVKSLGDFHMLNNEGSGHGIDIRKEGSEEFLYLSADNTALDFAKMNLKGELVWRRGRKELHADSGKYPEGAAYRPTNISFSHDGGYFLGDGYGSNLIHQYDKNDKYVRTIGGTGAGEGQFQTPHGQWLDARDGTPKLVVADRANKRLQWFDMDGKYLAKLDGFLFDSVI